MSFKRVQSGGLNEGQIDVSFNISKQMQIILGELIESGGMMDASKSANNIYHMQMINIICILKKQS